MERPITGLKIALAEDDLNLQKTYVAMLQRLGHVVICAASNGAELLERCRDQQLDVVLLDLEMPVLDGLSAAEDVSSQGVPVVLVSGHQDAAQVVLESEPIAARVLKPVTIDELQRALELAIASKGGSSSKSPSDEKA